MRFLSALGGAVMVLVWLVVLAVVGIGLLVVDVGIPNKYIAGAIWLSLLALAIWGAFSLARGKSE